MIGKVGKHWVVRMHGRVPHLAAQDALMNTLFTFCAKEGKFSLL